MAPAEEHNDEEWIMALVEIRELKKVFHRDTQEILVFDGVDLDIEQGGFLALMGPSGSGKSTLLHLLAGLDTPTAGRIKVGEANVTAMSRKQLAGWRARHIGFVFQFYNLLPVLTAFQNVELPLLLTPLSRAERRDHVMTALEVVGLTDRAEHFPRQLSGGQEQRVGIARAIVSDPTILLADEPTGDLDAKSAEEILTLLQRLNAEYAKTILLVTHDAHAAERAHAVTHLDKGVLSR
jgi:putative ABC transport system ATP-binding protein